MAVAESLAQITRDTDVVARVGGDEFAVLLPETTTAETQVLVARFLDAADAVLYQTKAAGGGLAVMAKPTCHLKTSTSSHSV